MPLKKDLGQWISHFKDSDAPQFRGKSEEQRKDMALAAFRKKYGSALEEASKEEETEFHKKLDTLVHDTFGKRKGEMKEMDYGSVLMRNLMPGTNDLEQYVDILIMDPKIASSSTEQEFRSLLRDKVEKANFFGSKDKVSHAAERILTFGNNAGKYSDTITRVFNMVKGKSANEAAKPDFLDVDKDGDKKETMKKALTDKAMKKVKEVVVTDDAEKAEDIANKTGEEVKVVKKGTIQEGREYDYEGKMAQAQLLSIVKNSRDLFNMIGKDDQLKSWVQSKLTKAEDYLDSVRTYLEGESLTTTAPVVVQEDRVKDEEGTNLNIGDVVKAGDGRIYQIIFSYSENKPFLVPFDLKKRKPTTLRSKVYFDSEDLITKKLNKIMDYSATKGGFMK